MSERSGFIELIMTVRILKSGISIMDAFNKVRNQQSLAHDNPVLNSSESLIIFTYVTSIIRFIRELEERLNTPSSEEIASRDDDDDLPF